MTERKVPIYERRCYYPGRVYRGYGYGRFCLYRKSIIEQYKKGETISGVEISQGQYIRIRP